MGNEGTRILGTLSYRWRTKELSIVDKFMKIEDTVASSLLYGTESWKRRRVEVVHDI